jgi:hypothetical protein
MESSATIPAQLAAWRPQRFGTGGPRKVADPIVEPLWEGVRVLVRVGLGGPATESPGPSVEIVNDAGRTLFDFAEIAAAIAAAARASSLVLDGYLTGQATRPSEGVGLEGPEAPTAADMAAQLFLGSAGRRRRHELDRSRRTATSAGPLAFVAVDLLLVDDEPLVDVPLLERKRILEGVLEEGDLVRRSVFVRPPVDPWLGTWRSVGFGSLAYKAANSRYRPGEPNPAWATVRIPQR